MAYNNMLLAPAVVVWEWLNEHGRWRPYGPAVSHHIEAAIRNSDPRGGSVVLGQVDSRLSPYIIDLQSMHQFRQDTGTIRPVRRCFYEPGTAPAQGVQWEWESSTGAWTTYDMEASIAIHKAHSRQQAGLDLEPLGLAQLIDFSTMTQVNRQSGRCRRLRRRVDMAYPLVSGPLPRGAPRFGGGALLGVGVAGSNAGNAPFPNGPAAGPAPSCDCQQCVLVRSVKSGGVQTLGRRTKRLPAPPPQAPPRSATLGHAPRQSCDWQLPHGLAISRNTASPRKNAQLFAQSLAALSVSSALTSGSADRPSRSANRDAPHADRPVPIATLVTPATVVTTPPSPVPSPSPVVMKPNGDVSLVPLPRRSSLAGLSRPALQRIARAQNRTLLAAGIPMVPVKNIKPSSLIQPALAGITGTLMSAAGLPVCLTRPPEDHPLVPKNLLRPVPGFTSCCRKTSKKQTRKGRSPEEVVRRYVLKVKTPQDQDCPICMDPLAGPAGYVGPQTGSSARADTVVRLAECGHVQHLGCLLAHYDASCRDGSLQCAICKTVYGVRTGNQPAGKMQFHVIPPSLPGYPDCKTIRIVYNIPAGTQGPEDVNPGKPFTARGFPRHCYLPDTPKGRQVLGLLVVAWERRLVFTVGRSCTSGEEDTVVWNQVHHKTEFGSNLTGHGYPDPGHLDSMVDQLRALGVGPDDLL
ncbi:E3 ubiquitin-protein ligase DTX4 isoform X1 [Gadus morhua]|uniref:E3 ubiquitin-protein ligase n=2 Tax=Gadus morhua TaxID=8049 RepID=A0A8C5FSG0_GADMO|nr:E3 ubiquitin-protein ligase DTX4-like isoform X1 [Gadus morhua]